MIDDPNHPEMQRAARELTQRLTLIAVVRRGAVDRETLRQFLAARDEHRIEWRAKGYDLPRLVLFCVQRLGAMSLEYWREDLDPANVRIKVVNFVKLHPSVTPREMGSALRAAYPRLRPGDLLRPVYAATHGDLDALDLPGARRLAADLKRLN